MESRFYFYLTLRMEDNISRSIIALIYINIIYSRSPHSNIHCVSLVIVIERPDDVACAAGGEPEGVHHHVLPVLGDGDQLVLQVVLPALGPRLAEHLASTTLHPGAETAADTDQLLELGGSFRVVHDKHELSVCILGHSWHNYVHLHLTNILQLLPPVPLPVNGGPC